MKDLKTDIRMKSFRRAYLLYGEEKFLVRYYENLLKSTLLPAGADIMNLDVYEEKEATAQRISDACRTAPFLNEYRLILVKDSKLFLTGRKADSDALADFLSDIPDSSVLAFVEDEADKRGKLFKKLSETGLAVEFKTPSDKELLDWINNMVKKRGGSIARDAAQALLRTAARNMEALSAEIEKLTAYAGAGRAITADDIQKICVPALETQIFDLVGAVGNKKPERALDIFGNMLLMKEQPLVVLTMIIRQFRLVLLTKELAEKGRSNNDIANFLSIRGFVVTECLSQGRGFKTEDLTAALRDCLEADMNIKNGRMSDKLAVESIIVKYAS